MPKLVDVPDIHLNEACGRPGHWVNSDPIDLLESANKGQDTGDHPSDVAGSFP